MNSLLFKKRQNRRKVEGRGQLFHRWRRGTQKWPTHITAMGVKSQIDRNVTENTTVEILEVTTTPLPAATWNWRLQETALPCIKNAL